MTKTPQQKQQEQLLLLLLIAGVGYYFFIYLPEEERKNKETQQTIQQEQIKTPEELEEDAWERGRIWELPEKSWADRIVRCKKSALAAAYQKHASLFPDGDRNEKFHFSRGSPYEIYFPPALQSYYEKKEEIELRNCSCSLIKKEKELILSEEIKRWLEKVENNPIRGGNENNDKEKDNSAIFYGAPGTGKTATMQNICVRANKYPLVVIKGSNLTPTESDQSAEILPLQKFAYTISELEWTLEKDFGFEREESGEIRYILFVDEANQISNNSLIFQPNELKFLKDCLEGVDKDERSNNLWVFATNHLNQVEEAVYRKGRLSNPLDFSWNWKVFKEYAERANIQLPERWLEKDGLTPEDQQWLEKFNIDDFERYFIGDNKDNPNQPRFWDLFISENPDAKYIPEGREKEKKSNENENDKEDEEEEEELEEEIEVGEFLEFFWYTKKKNMENFQGKYFSIRKPTIDKVLESSLNNLTKIINKKLDTIIEQLEETDDDGEYKVLESRITKLEGEINLFKSK